MKTADTLSLKWAALAPREQRMLLLMCVLLAAFALWYALLLPLRGWRQDSQQRYDRAAAELQAIEQALADWPQPGNGPWSAQALSDSASAAGLPQPMIQRGQDGQLHCRLQDADAGRVFAWLARLREQGQPPVRVQLQRQLQGLDVELVMPGGRAP